LPQLVWRGLERPHGTWPGVAVATGAPASAIAPASPATVAKRCLMEMFTFPPRVYDIAAKTPETAGLMRGKRFQEDEGWTGR
jgi:hypothetical protein